MTDWIARYWMEALFGVVIAILGAAYRNLAGRIKKSQSEQNAVKDGIQALLRDRIIQAYNHYTERGCCPIYALENVEALYVQYKELGGNGAVTTLVEELRELPRKKEE